MATRQTKEQERSKFALAKVKEVPAKIQGAYRQLAKSAPADIQSNGLGQTVAFWKSKKKDEYDRLYDHLKAWLSASSQMNFGDQDLIEWIANTDSVKYRQATAESLAILGWIKRLAEGLIEDKAADRDED
jgi:CRISPR-associated protein Cmr5